MIERDIQVQDEEETERLASGFRGLLALARQVDMAAILEEYARRNTRSEEIDAELADVDAEHTRRRREGAVRAMREGGASAISAFISDLPDDVRGELARLERHHAALLEEKEEVDNIIVRIRVGVSHMAREVS